MLNSRHKGSVRSIIIFAQYLVKRKDNMDILKIDENQIEVTKTESVVSKNTFSYEYLVAQKEAIQAQKDRDNAQRDKEIAEVDALLLECDRVGVTFKVEPIIEPTVKSTEPITKMDTII